MSRFLRVFATRKEWRGRMNNLIGKTVLFQKPFVNVRGETAYTSSGWAGKVVDFTEDLLNVLIVEDSSGQLFVVPIDRVRVVKNV